MNTKIGNVKTSDLREKLVIAMVKMASNGSVPAAQAVAKMIDDFETNAMASEHRKKMASLSSKPEELCRYLGMIGEVKSELARHLGRDPHKNELDAFVRGTKDRRLEMRAIELESAKKGGKVEDWMKR